MAAVEVGQDEPFRAPPDHNEDMITSPTSPAGTATKTGITTASLAVDAPTDNMTADETTITATKDSSVASHDSTTVTDKIADEGLEPPETLAQGGEIAIPSVDPVASVSEAVSDDMAPPFEKQGTPGAERETDAPVMAKEEGEGRAVSRDVERRKISMIFAPISPGLSNIALPLAGAAPQVYTSAATPAPPAENGGGASPEPEVDAPVVVEAAGGATARDFERRTPSIGFAPIGPGLSNVALPLPGAARQASTSSAPPSVRLRALSAPTVGTWASEYCRCTALLSVLYCCRTFTQRKYSTDGIIRKFQSERLPGTPTFEAD